MTNHQARLKSDIATANVQPFFVYNEPIPPPTFLKYAPLLRWSTKNFCLLIPRVQFVVHQEERREARDSSQETRIYHAVCATELWSSPPPLPPGQLCDVAISPHPINSVLERL